MLMEAYPVPTVPEIAVRMRDVPEGGRGPDNAQLPNLGNLTQVLAAATPPVAPQVTSIIGADPA